MSFKCGFCGREEPGVDVPAPGLFPGFAHVTRKCPPNGWFYICGPFRDADKYDERHACNKCAARMTASVVGDPSYGSDDEEDGIFVSGETRQGSDQKR